MTRSSLSCVQLNKVLSSANCAALSSARVTAIRQLIVTELKLLHGLRMTDQHGPCLSSKELPR